MLLLVCAYVACLCREGYETLTLSKGNKIENWHPFKGEKWHPMKPDNANLCEQVGFISFLCMDILQAYNSRVNLQ